MMPDHDPPVADGHDPSVFEYTRDATIAAGYDAHHQGTVLFETDTAFLDEVIRPGSRVVDIGCGTGRHVAHLARMGCEVTGVDLSAAMLRETGKRLDREGCSGRLVRADMCRLDEFDEGSFDAAISMFSSMAILRGRRLRLTALAEWRRVLAPGGLLVVHVHNVWHNLLYHAGRWWVAWSLLSSILPRRVSRAPAEPDVPARRSFGDKWMEGYCGLKRLYLHIFRLRELRGLLTKSGFKIERELLLNEERSGPIAGRWRSLRANGFILAARKA